MKKIYIFDRQISYDADFLTKVLSSCVQR